MEALLSDSTDFSHILLNLVNNLIYDYFCCISLLFHSKWRICKSSWNQQHWNVNWSHHQFPYQHHRLHCITTRPDRFGHTNSISNHYRLTHSFTGKLCFWSWFTLFLGVFDFDSHFLVSWKKKIRWNLENAYLCSNEIAMHKFSPFHVCWTKKAAYSIASRGYIAF